MIAVANRLISYKMIPYEHGSGGTIQSIIIKIINECKIETNKFKKELERETNKDILVVYDFERGSELSIIKLFAYEK
ncbi:hypothetical protein P5641_00215 (plasmid) [Bacillus subtilis]|uniref:hypothetical protein n=1 Tax=Bacillus subtilis TaxID=1423 RepID=UPI00084A06F4|nr:hypothetical protein [Bacillus subtilis]ODV47982.1 hypothetical protein BCM26_06125 [Bacillus subtilis]OJH63580.1 hypothetical protein BOH71_10070 [Bacillus subtilis]WEY94596.1 hypothetical protein P5641_00215 [Bacillus subtilis]